MKLTKILIAAFAFLAVVLTSCDDKVIPAEQLPAAAQTYIQQKYPGSNILIVKKDNELFSDSYEVKLDNGLELNFDSDGMITDIDN